MYLSTTYLHHIEASNITTMNEEAVLKNFTESGGRVVTTTEVLIKPKIKMSQKPTLASHYLIRFKNTS